MYLKKLEIKNFRRLSRLTIALRPALNVIVGENNIGKTDLLDSIRQHLRPVRPASTASGFPKRIERAFWMVIWVIQFALICGFPQVRRGAW